MKTIYIMKVEFTAKPAFFKELKDGENYEGVEEELAMECLKSMKQFFKDVSLEDFRRYCCKVSRYSEEIDENEIRTNRVYF